MKDISKIEKAWEYYRKNDLPNAAKICNSIVKTKKYQLDANYLLGLISFDEKRFTAALHHFEECNKLDVDKKNAGFIYYWIGRTYGYSESFTEDDNPLYSIEKAHKFYSESREQKRYPSDTIFKLITRKNSDIEKLNLYDEGIEKFPDVFDFYIYKANIHKGMGYSSKQIETLELAIAKGLKSSSLYFNIGDYYYKQNDFILAEENYLKCLEINDNRNAFLLIHYMLGNCYYQQKKYEKAANHYKAGYEMDKNDSNIWFNVFGLILTWQKLKKNEFITSLFAGIPIDRNLFEYISIADYAFMSYFDGELMETVPFSQNIDSLILLLEDLNIVSLDELESLKISLMLAELYDTNKDELNRLKVLRSCNIYPAGFDFIASKLAESYVAIADSPSFSIEIGDFFIQDLSNENISTPLKVIALRNIVSALNEKKEYDKVILICEKFHDKDIEKYDLTFYYAYSLKIKDKWKDAKYYYELHLKSKPKSTGALNNLGVIYKEQGDYEKAISLYKEAIKHESDEVLYQNNLQIAVSLYEKRVKEDKQKRIPENWNSAIKCISIDNLDALQYFAVMQKIERINKKYRALIERDFKELVFNHLTGNYKSTIVISGSLVEMVLIYFCERKKHKFINIKNSKGQFATKKLYDAVLNDLISFIEAKKMFGNDFQHLGNLARVYRNFIHPGLELKNKIDIKSKSELCFISAIEILRKILV